MAAAALDQEGCELNMQRKSDSTKSSLTGKVNLEGKYMIWLKIGNKFIQS